VTVLWLDGRAADPEIDRLALAGYFERVGVAAPEPSRDALNELHEAHVRSFMFDVLFGQHPGVGLAAVQLRSAHRYRSPLGAPEFW
jgi:N-hydroxyarylamine O-acetyltransferase